jgi:hypothetical protein
MLDRIIFEFTIDEFKNNNKNGKKMVSSIISLNIKLLFG